MCPERLSHDQRAVVRETAGDASRGRFYLVLCRGCKIRAKYGKEIALTRWLSLELPARSVRSRRYTRFRKSVNEQQGETLPNARTKRTAVRFKR